MWQTEVQSVGAGVQKISWTTEGHGLETRDAWLLCRDDPSFRQRLLDELARPDATALFWELPPVSSTTLGRPFEFVLGESPTLARVTPEPRAFSEHFVSDPGDGVVVFDNLGRDATLVVPCPLVSEPEVYTHLANFVRQAPEAQRHALLARVAGAVLTKVNAAPLWVSTAGLGVYWLHVRLDRRPKYYRHAAYKQPE